MSDESRKNAHGKSSSGLSRETKAGIGALILMVYAYLLVCSPAAIGRIIDLCLWGLLIGAVAMVWEKLAEVIDTSIGDPLRAHFRNREILEENRQAGRVAAQAEAQAEVEVQPTRGPNRLMSMHDLIARVREDERQQIREDSRPVSLPGLEQLIWQTRSARPASCGATLTPRPVSVPISAPVPVQQELRAEDILSALGIKAPAKVPAKVQSKGPTKLPRSRTPNWEHEIDAEYDDGQLDEDDERINRPHDELDEWPDFYDSDDDGDPDRIAQTLAGAQESLARLDGIEDLLSAQRREHRRARRLAQPRKPLIRRKF